MTETTSRRRIFDAGKAEFEEMTAWTEKTKLVLEKLVNEALAAQKPKNVQGKTVEPTFVRYSSEADVRQHNKERSSYEDCGKTTGSSGATQIQAREDPSKSLKPSATDDTFSSTQVHS